MDGCGATRLGRLAAGVLRRLAILFAAGIQSRSWWHGVSRADQDGPGPVVGWRAIDVVGLCDHGGPLRSACVARTVNGARQPGNGVGQNSAESQRRAADRAPAPLQYSRELAG